MQTVRDRLIRNFRLEDPDTDTGDRLTENLLDHQQSISEFLDNAERIASSKTRSSSEGKRKAEFLDEPSKGRKRPMGDKEGDSHSRDCCSPRRKNQPKDGQDNFKNREPLSHDDDDNSIPIDHDENIVRAVIAHDEQLNREVTELFDMDPFFSDDQSGSDYDDDSDDGLDCNKLKKCLSGCMFLH
jgi:hypothetical protein